MIEACGKYLGTLSWHLCGGGCAHIEGFVHGCGVKHVTTIGKDDAGSDAEVMEDTEVGTHCRGECHECVVPMSFLAARILEARTI